MKVYITKYALTSGIEEIEVELCSDSMVRDMAHSRYFHGDGKDWHRSLESAKTKAEEMRNKKIASLKKQIDKLERLEF